MSWILPPYLDADELAATFAPFDNATSITVPTGNMSPIIGVPSLGLSNRTVVWLLDAAAVEDVGGAVYIPTFWNTMHADIYWVNAGVGAGDVLWRFDIGAITVGSASPDPTAGSNVAVTASAQNIVASTRLATGVAAPNGLTAYEVVRLGTDAADTLANDVGLAAVIFTRAS